MAIKRLINPDPVRTERDYARYPRTLDADSAGLRLHGCDLLFAPGVAEVYPYGATHSATIAVPEITAPLEGSPASGHFTGVATVVTKLLNLVQPDVAVFGQKDYQQLLVVRRRCAISPCRSRYWPHRRSAR